MALGGGGIGCRRPGHLPARIAALRGRQRSRASWRRSTRASRSGAATRRRAISEACQTGPDANAREDCRIVGVVNSIQAYWTGSSSAAACDTVRRHGLLHRPGRDRLRRRELAVGPFYCPPRQARLSRPGLLRRAGSRSALRPAPFAEAYVIAHEYGHHVQDLLGNPRPDRERPPGPGPLGPPELQADCYAGVWANHATQTGYPGQPLARGHCRGARRGGVGRR